MYCHQAKILSIVIAAACFSACGDTERAADDASTNIETPANISSDAWQAQARSFVQSLESECRFQLLLAESVIDTIRNERALDLAYGVKIDYTRVQDEIESMEATYRWTLPEGIDPQHAAKLEQLNSVPVETMHQEYASIVAESHTALLHAVESQLEQELPDIRYRTWLQTLEPMIKRHRESAKALQQLSEAIP